MARWLYASAKVGARLMSWSRPERALSRSAQAHEAMEFVAVGGIVAAEPDRPQGVGRHAGNIRVVVVQPGGHGRVDPASPKSQGQQGGPTGPGVGAAQQPGQRCLGVPRRHLFLELVDRRLLQLVVLVRVLTRSTFGQLIVVFDEQRSAHVCSPCLDTWAKQMGDYGQRPCQAGPSGGLSPFSRGSRVVPARVLEVYAPARKGKAPKPTIADGFSSPSQTAKEDHHETHERHEKETKE